MNALKTVPELGILHKMTFWGGVFKPDSLVGLQEDFEHTPSETTIVREG